MDFHFDIGEGLHYGDAFVSEFDVYVSSIIEVEYADEAFRDEISYEVVAVTLEGKELPSVIIKELNNIKFFHNWPEIPDATLSKKTRDLLTLRLQKSVMEANVVKQVVCSRNGLVGYDNQKVLIIGDTCFGKIKKQVVFSEAMKKYRWRCNVTDISCHLSTIRTMREVAPNCSEILAATVLTAAMKPLFVEAGFPLDFCINVYGKSGTHKTSLTNAITDVTESPGLLRGSFLNDSKKKLLDKIKTGYGFVVILDDYHPAARDYDMKKQTANMDVVARQMENDGRTALVVMTSEFLDGCFSLQDRMLQLEMQPVDLKLLSKLQRENYLIAQMVKDFLEVLVQNYDEVITFIRNHFCNSTLVQDDVSSRLARNGEYLIVAAMLCEKFLFGGKDILVSSLRAALQYQTDIQRKHLASIKKYEEIEDYVLVVYKILNAGIWELCSDVKKEYQCLNNQVCVKRSGMMIYITKNSLRYGIKKYYEMQKVDISKIVKALHENDILLEDADATTKKFMKTRHLCISYYELLKYVAAENGENVSEQLEKLECL